MWILSSHSVQRMARWICLSGVIRKLSYMRRGNCTMEGTVGSLIIILSSAAVCGVKPVAIVIFGIAEGPEGWASYWAYRCKKWIDSIAYLAESIFASESTWHGCHQRRLKLLYSQSQSWVESITDDKPRVPWSPNLQHHWLWGSEFTIPLGFPPGLVSASLIDTKILSNKEVHCPRKDDKTIEIFNRDEKWRIRECSLGIIPEASPRVVQSELIWYQVR